MGRDLSVNFVGFLKFFDPFPAEEFEFSDSWDILKKKKKLFDKIVGEAKI